jgi:phosphatidylglycerol lysyltransferase
MPKVRLIFVVRLCLWIFTACIMPAAPVSVSSEHAPLKLHRGTFDVVWTQPVNVPVRGYFVLGSGDGGWSYWEQRAVEHLAKRGWAVAGVDFSNYGASDYSQEILSEDYLRLVDELVRRTGGAGDSLRPVIYGGWSMGAEQALPAAAYFQKRPNLRGLLLVAPGARGRYGLHLQDRVGLKPTGAGTFALADFAPQLRGMRLAQLHAGLDPLDSIDWYRGLNLDLKLWKYPRAFHDFDNASDEFFDMMDKALTWLLSAPAGLEQKP